MKLNLTPVFLENSTPFSAKNKTELTGSAFEVVDLNTVIQEIVRDLDISIKEKMATIYTDNLPTLRGNKIRLRQLLLNLISNALKYSKKDIPPHITITSSAVNGHVGDTVYGIRDGCTLRPQHPSL